MKSDVDLFDASENDAFRVSFTHFASSGTGEATARTDTFHGRSVKPKHKSERKSLIVHSVFLC